MDSCTKINKVRHVKDVIKKIKSSEGLPFSEILSSKVLGKTISDYGGEFRKRVFYLDLTIWTLLSQVMSEDQSLQGAVSRAIAFLMSSGETPPSANTAAYSKARDRLPEDLLSTLAKDTGNELEGQAPAHWHIQNRPIKLVDGSTVSMPDTSEN